MPCGVCAVTVIAVTCNSFHFLTYHFVRVRVGAAGVPATGVATREATIPYGAAESGRVPSKAACGTAADDGATTAIVSAAGYCTRPGSVACSSIDTYSTYVFLLAAHSIVVRMLVSTGKLSPSFARLVVTCVTTLWYTVKSIKHALSVHSTRPTQPSIHLGLVNESSACS